MVLILKTIVFISIFELFKTQTLHSCYNVLGQRFRPDFDDCSKYHLCSPQKDWILDCAPGTTWNQDKNICVTKGSIEDTCSKQSMYIITVFFSSCNRLKWCWSSSQFSLVHHI